MSTKGAFVISLDLELYWGMFDKVTLEAYGENIRGAHSAVPAMLRLFAQYDIHATWAAVGMLMAQNKEELYDLCPPPSLQPNYEDMRVSSYEHMRTSPLGKDETDDAYHYGASLIAQILAAPHQELGSHTFSHYYTLDGGKNGEAVFAADCEAFNHAAARFGAPVTSIVFPRNQASEEALRISKAHGITAYRGTPSHILYTGKKEKDQINPLWRILRLIDAYMNISGHHAYPLSRVREPILANVVGSRFLRPYSRRLRFFEPLRIARIKHSMTYAAKRGEVFHLWWHPHNFGINRKENLRNLADILEHFSSLREEYGMESANMREVAIRANGSPA